MLYSAAALLAIASSAVAQLAGYHNLVKPLAGEVIPAGKPYTLEWKVSTLPNVGGPVNLVLVGGPNAQSLAPLSTIASGIDPTAEKYVWNVDASLGKLAAYGVKIELASDPKTYQWSNGFTISPASGDADTSSTASTGAPTSGSTSAPTAKTTTESSSSMTFVPSGNRTTTNNPPTQPPTTTPTGTGSGSGANTPSTTSSTTRSTAAAATAYAGSLAILGGVAMAAFAL